MKCLVCDKEFDACWSIIMSAQIVKRHDQDNVRSQGFINEQMKLTRQLAAGVIA